MVPAVVEVENYIRTNQEQRQQLQSLIEKVYITNPRQKIGEKTGRPS
jgi:hypothetical protein